MTADFPREMLFKHGKEAMMEMTMLVELSVANFRSIGAEQKISMIASSDPSHSSHVIRDGNGTKPGLSLLRSILLYGANASGKSNVCRALYCMRRLVLDSSTKLNEGDPLPEVVAFKLHSELIAAPSRFEVQVLIEGDLYRYGFAVTATEIHEEWLYFTRRAPRSREILLFHRVGSDKSKWVSGPGFSGNADHLRERTRASNCLLLSKGSQESYAQLSPLYNWFRNKLLIFSTMLPLRRGGTLRTAEMCERSPKFASSLGKLIRIADEQILDVKADTTHIDVPENLRRIVSALTPEGESVPLEYDQTEFTFVRKQSDSDRKVSFNFDDESHGTQRFFSLITEIVVALKNGQTVVCDELERSIHPSLTRQIVEIMNDDELSANGAQFMIATHESSLFDFDLLRRDQIFLVEKGLNHQTDVFSLYDLEPRPKSDAAAEKQYLNQRFGGVPTLGNLRLAIATALEVDTSWDEPNDMSIQKSG